MPIEDLYPSRAGNVEQIIPRNDPVVYGNALSSDEHTLSRSQLESYSENGFIILPDYMPEMVAPLLDEIRCLKKSMANNDELITEPDSQNIRSLFRPHKYSALIYIIPGSHKLYVCCSGSTDKKNYTGSLKMQQAGVPHTETMQQILHNRTIKTAKPLVDIDE